MIETSDYIFTGTVNQLNEQKNALTKKDSLVEKIYFGKSETSSPYATFLVLQNFKRVNEETIEIEQDLGSCTQIFHLNEEYLIFGRIKEDGSIDTSICASFRLDSKSKSLRKILRQLNKTKSV